MKETKS